MLTKNFQFVIKFVVMLGLGVGLGLLCILFIYPHMPSDLKRINALMEAAQKTSPDGVFLGNSIVMSAIDAREVSSRNNGQPLIYNFGTTGQSLYESVILMEHLPESVAFVCLGVHPDILSAKTIPFPEVKYTAYIMYGAAPEAAMKKQLFKIEDENLNKLMSRPYLYYVAHARSIVKTAINTTARNLLRSDLNTDRAQSDLYFPTPYTEPVSEKTLEYQFQKFHPPRSHFQISSKVQQTLALINRLAGDSGFKFILLILPEHPRFKEITEARFYDELNVELKEFSKTVGVQIIDLHDFLLREDEFIDHWHISPEAAEKVSAEVADQLK